MADIITSVSIQLSSRITLYNSLAGQTNRIQNSRLTSCGPRCDFNIIFGVKLVTERKKGNSDVPILAIPVLWLCVWACMFLLVLLCVLATERYGQWALFENTVVFYCHWLHTLYNHHNFILQVVLNSVMMLLLLQAEGQKIQHSRFHKTAEWRCMLNERQRRDSKSSHWTWIFRYSVSYLWLLQHRSMGAGQTATYGLVLANPLPFTLLEAAASGTFP